MILDRDSFILTHTRLQPVPHAPELSLHLADEVTPIWQLTEEALARIGLPPPFWAFAWAGGQALARYVLDNRSIVAGKSVLDFASGSGLVGIAAMKAGARDVLASEIDDFALHAIALNGRANGVCLDARKGDLIGDMTIAADVILAGDVCYERPMAEGVTEWLAALADQGKTVLVGDPGRYYLPRDRLEALASYEVPVVGDLEDREVKRTHVWRFRAITAPG